VSQKDKAGLFFVLLGLWGMAISIVEQSTESLDLYISLFLFVVGAFVFLARN